MRISDWSSDLCSSDLRPLGGHEDIARRVVQAPDLHIAHIAGIADVDRVVEQRAGVVARLQLLAQAAEPPGAPRRLIGRIRNGCRPRSEERRVGTKWASTVRTRWWQYP